MIASASAPDAGSVRLGASLIKGYFAQQPLDVIDPDLTIIEQLQKDFPQDGLGSLWTLAGGFHFSGEDVDKKIRALTGGEQSRLPRRACCPTRRILWCWMSRRITSIWR